MPEFEDDLRARLREDAARVRPDVDEAWSNVTRRLAAVRPARGRVPAWQRQWWAVPAAAALVAVVAAAVLLPGGDDPTTVAVGPPEAAEDADAAGELPDAATEMRWEAPGTTPAGGGRGSLEPAGDQGGDLGPFPGIFPAASWEDYERLRDQAAQAGRTWTPDPIQVAERYLRERAGVEPDGQIRPRHERVVEYDWSGGRVVLWRDGPPGAPWVVTGSEARSVDVGIGDYRGEEVAVGVRLEQAGTVTVRAGAFDSQWIAVHEEQLAAGDGAEATLPVGSGGAAGPAELLVDIRVAFADGSNAFAQYRVNRVTAPPGE